jgi:hypothetical protein
VTALDGLGGVAAAAMQTRAHVAGKRDDRGYRFHIRLVMISNNRLRRDVRAFQGLAKKRFRTRPIPFVAQEHIDNLSVFINRTIQVEFLLAPKAEDFVDRPFLSHSPSMRTECGGQLRAKRLHPVEHRAGRDINVALG